MSDSDLIAKGNALLDAIFTASTDFRVIAKLRAKIFKNKTLPHSIINNGYSRPGDPENNLPNGLLARPIQLDSQEKHYAREEGRYV